ncbi:MAG: hypothetical protein V4719_30705 [Planctomycetota bacterium]
MSTESQSDFDRLPEELPPVQPPSAGFIAQLFLVPGLIVLAIVVVWLLISRMASVEQDWRSLVNDIQSPQDHIRSRGIFGLAQQLLAEQNSTTPGPKLRDNPDIAQQLADYLIKELKTSAASEATVKQQAILSRTLGLFHLPEIVLPALAQAVQPQHDLEVRKNALGSIAVIAGRAMEEKKPLNLELIQPAVIETATDSAPLVRQLAAFILGLMPGDVSHQRLSVLLEDADLSTRINAAVGLARQDSPAGFTVFADVLKDAIAKPATIGSPEEFAQFAQIKNTLAAFDKVESKLTAEQRTQLQKLLEPISTTYREPKLRVEAQLLLKKLQGK